MKYDDAEHVMKVLEDAYPDDDVNIISSSGQGSRSNRIYGVRMDFPKGLDINNMKALTDLTLPEGVSATMSGALTLYIQ